SALRASVNSGPRQWTCRHDSEGEIGHEHTVFARWGKYVSTRPLRWAVLATIALLVLAAPLFSMRLGQLDAGTDPTTDSSRRAYDLIDEKFGPGANGPLVVVTDIPQESKQKQQTMLSDLQKQLKKTDDVASVSPAATNQSGTVATYRVVPKSSPQAASTQTLVRTIRSDVLDNQKEPAYVVGTTASNVDFTDKVGQRMPWLIAVVVLIGFTLLTAAFRSVVIGVKAAVLNLLSIGAAYGVIVAIFQWGWGASLIGIEETVPIPAYVPMFVFAIVFGLSMDYEVFLLSRVHDEWLRTGDSAMSVAIGLGATGRVITTAAAVMVAVFTSFIFADDPAVKMLAVGMAVAVLIDASIVRMLLVPAIMAMLGAHAWWAPPPIRRRVAPADVEPAPG
ncbi:MAG: MMPL family transporter, partial [Actinomycetia bacterium]|nr:MMPL family transporter [Actinomycetes bacterium]